MPCLCPVGSKWHVASKNSSLKHVPERSSCSFLPLYFPGKTCSNKAAAFCNRTSLCWNPAVPCTSLPASALLSISQLRAWEQKNNRVYPLWMSASTNITSGGFPSIQSWWAFKECHGWEWIPLALLLFGRCGGSKACSLLLSWAEPKGLYPASLPQYHPLTAPHAWSSPTSWKHFWFKRVQHLL